MAESTTQLTNHGEKGEGVKSITLLNGTELVCYPSIQRPRVIKGNDMSYDLSEGFFDAAHKPSPKLKHRDPEIMNWEKEMADIFIDNAFLFLRNANKIFQDSRMFLAYVPIESGIIESAAHHPTLGIYLEWWMYGPSFLREDEKGNPMLLCGMAGSLFTGANRCLYALPDGGRKRMQISDFGRARKSFSDESKRYAHAKHVCDAYTLREVVDILKAEEDGCEAALSARLRIEENKNCSLKQDFLLLKDHYEELKQEYYAKCVELGKDALNKVRDEYHVLLKASKEENNAIQEKRKELKREFNAGVYNQKEYQIHLHPLQLRELELRRDLAIFLEENVKQLIETTGLSDKDVLDCILEENHTEGCK